MSDVTLVVQHGSLETMLSALQTAHDDIEKQISDTIAHVNREIAQWGTHTVSRAAHDQHQKKLTDGVEKLTKALEKVHTALAKVKADAHDAEVKNVAIVD